MLLIGDMWLAEAWVEFNSQRITVTDDQCKNTVTIALRTKGVDTRYLQRLTCSGTTK